MRIISDPKIDDPNLLPFRTLRDKVVSKEGVCIADTARVAAQLLSCGLEAVALLTTPERMRIHDDFFKRFTVPTLYLVAPDMMEKIVGHTLHQHFILMAKRPDPSPLSMLGKTVVAACDITSTQNIGMIARSAAALGVEGFLLSPQTPHPYTRRSIRVSTGHIGRLRYHRETPLVDALKTLKSDGYAIYGAEVAPDAIAPHRLSPASKWVLVLGHEEYGLQQEILSLCDATLAVPMAEGVPSLNVSHAAAILLYTLTNITA